MKTKLLSSIILVLYPLLVYFGFKYFSIKFTVIFIITILIIRLVTIKNSKNVIEKNLFKFTLLATGILIISFLMKSYNLVKLYPIFISSGFAYIFILSLQNNKTPIIEKIARLSGEELSIEAVNYTRNVTKVWIGFFIFNICASMYTFFYSSLEEWTFYNGFLSYVLMGLLFLIEFLIRKKVKDREKTKLTVENLNVFFNKNNEIVDSKILLRKIKSAKLKIEKHQRILVKTDNEIDFTSAILAISSVGKSIILLPNNNEGTLKEYMEEYDFILSSEDLEGKDESYDVSVELDLKSKVVMFTSGTLGKPKKVLKNLNCLIRECRELEVLFGNEVKETHILSTVSYHHIYGILFRILWPLIYGRKISNENILYPEELSSMLKLTGKFTLISSPSFLKRINKEDFHGVKKEKIKKIFSSGGKLNYKDAENIKSIFSVVPNEVYGSTETGGMAYRVQKKANENWTSFPSVKTSVDPRSCLVVRSPFFLEDSIITNDMIDHLKDGSFTLKSRIDRVYKIEEKRVSLDELESKILELNCVKDVKCAVKAINNRDVIVCLIAENAELLNMEKIEKVEFIKAHLSCYFDRVLMPKKFRFLAELPYNEQSKLPVDIILGLFNES